MKYPSERDNTLSIDCQPELDEDIKKTFRQTQCINEYKLINKSYS